MSKSVIIETFELFSCYYFQCEQQTYKAVLEWPWLVKGSEVKEFIQSPLFTDF